MYTILQKQKLTNKHYKTLETLQNFTTTTQHFTTFHKNTNSKTIYEKNTELFFYKTLQQLYNTSQSSQQLQNKKSLQNFTTHYTTLQKL